MNKPSYQELENQNADLRNQNEILRLNSFIQSDEKEKRANDLVIANIELAFQNIEKEKRADDLVIANIELAFQNEEKAKRAAELIISNIKFAQQSDEKEKLEEGLIIANLALDLQSELIVAKKRENENELQLRKLNITKDKLFSIIAHDLRSPFHVILGFSELLINNLKKLDTEEVDNHLHIINTSAQNTLHLLENLLNWTQSQTGQISFNPKKLLFSEVIEEIITLENSSAKSKNISLKYSSLTKIEVYADENMLKTILRNLVSNAIKFTKSGGLINILAVSNDLQVEISVSDNGIGMNEKKTKELFHISSNPTTLGTANEKGSGLGLLVCKEFIEKHKGEIWAESKTGKGSDFKFTLPLRKLQKPNYK